MRKKLFILLVLLLVPILFSCDPIMFNLDIDELKTNLVDIELIKYENDEQKEFPLWMKDYSDRLLKFDSNKVSIIDNLEETKINDFLECLTEFEVIYKHYTFDSPKGRCAKLNYSNGDFIVIGLEKLNSGYIFKYDENGNVIEYTGKISGSKDFVLTVEHLFNYY